MDILIKGMVMPIGCGWRTENAYGFAKCPFYERCLEKGIRLTRESRPKVCPLVAVPSHGRLIDADEVIKVIRARIDNIDIKPDGSYYYAEDAFFINGLTRAIQSIENAPTVLEANT